MDKVAQTIKDIIFAGIDLLEKGLGVTFTTMIIQLLATLILFLVVRFFFWNKITKIIEDRKSLVTKGLEEKEQAMLEANLIKEQIIQERALAKKEASLIVDEAKKRASVEGREIIKSAKLEVEEEKAIAKEELRLEKEKLENEMKDKIVDVAYVLAGKIIEEELDDKKHKQLINRFIDQAGKQ